MLRNPDDGYIGRHSIAYKTGTAQKIINGHYVHDCHVASCSGFFPAEDPRYVVTVVVDGPESGGGVGWGSRFAKPLLLRIAEQIIRANIP
jgi:cell division protein FtsI/penicillin-binding protein 2